MKKVNAGKATKHASYFQHGRSCQHSSCMSKRNIAAMPAAHILLKYFVFNLRKKQPNRLNLFEKTKNYTSYFSLVCINNTYFIKYGFNTIVKRFA